MTQRTSTRRLATATDTDTALAVLDEDDMTTHTTNAALAALRAAAEKALEKARQVGSEIGPNPDRNGRNRLSRATQRAADARQAHDDHAAAIGAPLLAPLGTGTPAVTPRSSDEAAIAAAKAALVAAGVRLLAAGEDGRRMGRGKQALRRGDAQLDRFVDAGRDAEEARRQVRALGVPRSEIDATEGKPWAI